MTTSLARDVKVIEEWAKKQARVIVDFTLRHERIAVSFTGLGVVASKVFSHTIRTLIPGYPVIDASIDTLTYHIAPYTENLGIIVFVEKGTENSLIRLLDSAHYTGNHVLLVTPQPLQQVKARLRGQQLIQIEHPRRILGQVLLASISGYEIADKVRGRDEKALRFNRLRIEVHDYSSIVDELLSIYSSELRAFADVLDRVSVIAYTPTMESPAYYLQSIVLERTGKLLPLVELTSIVSFVEDKALRDNLIALFSTTVEEYSVKELLFKSMIARNKIIELKIRTDPLTAPVYAIILLEELMSSNI